MNEQLIKAQSDLIIRYQEKFARIQDRQYEVDISWPQYKKDAYKSAFDQYRRYQECECVKEYKADLLALVLAATDDGVRPSTN